MTQPVVFVFNGPRRVGKDTAADAVVGMAKRPDWIVDRVGPHGPDVGKHFGIKPATRQVWEALKDEPLDEFAGMSYRDLQIAYGNEMREKHGQSVFCDQWIERNKPLLDMGLASAIIMPNCRFDFELEAALALSPFTLLYRVYRTPKLHNDPDAWTGDIGSWLFPAVADVAQVSLINDGDIGDIRWTAFATAFHYFEQIQKHHAAAAV